MKKTILAIGIVALFFGMASLSAVANIDNVKELEQTVLGNSLENKFKKPCAYISECIIEKPTDFYYEKVTDGIYRNVKVTGGTAFFIWVTRFPTFIFGIIQNFFPKYIDLHHDEHIISVEFPLLILLQFEPWCRFFYDEECDMFYLGGAYALFPKIIWEE